MNCKNCNTKLPKKRSELGYRVCTECSDVETYGFVNIINHKTGNTIQPLPKSQAAAINKVGDRKRFGTILKGGSKSSAYNPKRIVNGGASSAKIGNEVLFQETGSQAMTILETRGYETASLYVDKRVREYYINENQAFKIKQVLKQFTHNDNCVRN